MMSQENVVQKTTVTAAAPAMLTATKKSVKMRPGVTTTARSIQVTNKIHCLIIYSGVSVLKTGAEIMPEEPQQNLRHSLIHCLLRI